MLQATLSREVERLKPWIRRSWKLLSLQVNSRHFFRQTLIRCLTEFFFFLFLEMSLILFPFDFQKSTQFFFSFSFSRRYPNNNKHPNLQRAKENFLNRRRNDSRLRIKKKEEKRKNCVGSKREYNRAKSTVQKYSTANNIPISRDIFNGMESRKGILRAFCHGSVSIVLSRRVWSVGGGASNR